MVSETRDGGVYYESGKFCCVYRKVCVLRKMREGLSRRYPFAESGEKS